MKRGSRKASTRRMQRENGAIETELLKSQIAILSGGTDVTGTPLITFPIKSENKTWDLDDVSKYLVYLQDVIFLIMKRKSAAFLANFRHGCHEDYIIDIIKALDHLENERRGAVAMFYVVKPKSKSKTRLLKKLLGLKSNKKQPVTFINQFKTTIVKNTSELYTQIDQKDLTMDYGGHLLYDHDVWIYLHKRILPTLAQSEDVKDRLHDIKDKALLMSEYDTIGQSSDMLKTLHFELEDQFNSLLRHSDLEFTVEKCKQTLHHLDDPDDDSPVIKVHSTILTQIITQIRNGFTELSASQIELETIWKTVDENIRKQMSLKEKKEEADKLCMEITERFWPLISQHPSIGTNLNQAEIYRNHFKSVLYDPAKEIIADATGILETLQRMDVRESLQHDEMRNIVERLTNTIHPFASQLNEINQIYVEIHVFFLVFEKALVWYKKALDIIPTPLCSRAANGDSRLLNTPSGWKHSIQTFMRKHPPPRDDHIAHIDVNIPNLVDRTTVDQAQLLADRLRLVISILRCSRLEANLLCYIYDWKIEKVSKTGDLILSDEDDDPQDDVDFLSSTHGNHRYMPPKRRVGRVHHRIDRYRNRREGGGSVMEKGSSRSHQSLRRTSSADTDNKANGSFDNNNIGKTKYKSEFSLNHQAFDNNDLDNVVEFIQKLTSSQTISSDKKLQYVSELILNLDLDDVSVNRQPKNTRRYSPSAKIIRKISRKSPTSDKKPSEEIAELNRRLCRSMDNIVDLNFDEDQYSVDRYDHSKSLFNLPNSYHLSSPYAKRQDDISVVPETNETSSRESVDSTIADGGCSRIIIPDTYNHNMQAVKGGQNFTTSDISNLIQNKTVPDEPIAKSYIMFHEHSRERSIDCTPNDDYKTKSCDIQMDTTENDESKENFKRRSVTRIASMYKNRKSWIADSKIDGTQPGITDISSPIITDNKLTPTDQKSKPPVPPKTFQTEMLKTASFDELDFSNGIFGSAPRKSMLSLSTDLGYDSQQDHTLSEDLKTSLTRSTSSGPPNRDRRHSITCGTSVLKLRRTSSNEPNIRMASHIINSTEQVKEYKV